jgi:hypothetical protein
MTYDINLKWKDCKVNLDMVGAWIKAHSSDCCGMSSDNNLRIHFTVEKSRDDAKEAVAAYWDNLDESSDEAKAYQSKEDAKAASDASKAAALADAAAKLKALGLSDENIAALRG